MIFAPTSGGCTVRRRRQRRRQLGLGVAGGEGNEGAQRGGGGEAAEIAMTMDTGRDDELGEAIEQLEDMQPNLCAATDVRLAQLIDNVVVRAEAQSALGEGVAGAVTHQTLEAGAVPVRYRDGVVDRKAAVMVPAEQSVDIVGVQTALALQVA